jgi:hypothetical protein
MLEAARGRLHSCQLRQMDHLAELRQQEVAVTGALPSTAGCRPGRTDAPEPGRRWGSSYRLPGHHPAQRAGRYRGCPIDATVLMAATSFE